MKSELSLDFLYYQTPEEYVLRLSGPTDPRRQAMIMQNIAFEGYMTECSLAEYIHLFTQILKDKYPNMAQLSVGLREITYEGKKAKVVEVYRDKQDVTTLEFIYELVDHGRTTEKIVSGIEYVKEIQLSLKEPNPSIIDWIIQGLEGKTLTLTNSGLETIINIVDSPVSKIIINKKQSVRFQIKMESFIYYPL